MESSDNKSFENFLEEETHRPMHVITQYSSHSDKKNAPKFQPSSPTDQILSPCSRKLMRKKSSRDSPSFNWDLWSPPTDMKLVLGSSSKSRAMILAELGWVFTSISPDIDERAVQDDFVGGNIDLPVAIAKAKASAIIKIFGEEKKNDIQEECIILTSDQITLFQDQIRGKPRDLEEARNFLSSYQSGESCQTVTAVVATHLPSGRQTSEIDVCTVHWSGIPPDAMDILLAKEDVMYSCGAFLIEDEDFIAHVRLVEGSLDSIRGLPIRAMKKVIASVT